MTELNPVSPPLASLAGDDEVLRWTNKRILTLLALGTLIVAVVWRLPTEAQYISARAGELLFTLVLAMAFTYLLRPSVDWMQRRVFKGHQGRTWATMVAFLGCGLLVWLFISVGLRPVTRDIQSLWNWFVAQGPEGREQLITRWQQTLEQSIAPYRYLLPEETNLDLRSLVAGGIGRVLPQLWKWLHHTGVHISFLLELLLLPVLVFYFLSDGSAIRRETKLLIPIEYRPLCARIAAHLDRVLDGYIRGQVIMCLIAWIAVTIGLKLLKIEHAWTLGLVAGLTRAVPVIGPLLGGIPIALICLVTTRSVPITAIILTGFIVMHFVESKILLPRIIGREVDLHPVAVIVVLLVGLEFFGLVGVFLAVPVAATIKILLAEWHAARHPSNVFDTGEAVPEPL